MLQRPNVDAAIIDLDLPLGGLEIYRLLKQWRPSLPIVFYTRHADHPNRVKQLRTLGVNNEDVFLKQDTSKDLLSMINRFERAWSASVAPTTGGAVA
jgi:CheY-like chemotaxis protein